MAEAPRFATEAELVAAFCSVLEQDRREKVWTAYHETAGWDLLLVHRDGYQLGIEAKLTLNAKVLEQALPANHWSSRTGPDYRAVLVGRTGLQNHLSLIARHLGITVISMGGYAGFNGTWIHQHSPLSLPDEAAFYTSDAWPNWCPAERCPLPEYVPDVTGGRAAPVQLSQWKIKAIKLLILLERNGAVTRADMKALQISPTRWTDHYAGFLVPGPGGYIRCNRTPDLKAQHPTNWSQIEADFPKWAAGLSSKPLLAEAV